MKRIDILYFRGCPNHKPAVEAVKDVADELGIDAEINEIEIRGPEDAEARCFLGSPSIRVDGVDVEPSARARSDFGFSCRTYSGKGLPDREMLAAALRDDDGSAMGAAPADSRADCCAADSPSATSVPRRLRRFGVSASAGSVIAAVAASACCWLPLSLIAFGFSVGSVGSVFEVTRPYFLTIATVMLSAGFYFTYVRKPNCEPGSACDPANKNPRRLPCLMLWVSTVVVAAFASFPLYVGVFQADPIEAASGSTDVASQTIELQIDGMTCAGCAVNVHNALMNVRGVMNTHIDYESGHASVAAAAEPGVSESILVNAVRNAGYSARSAQSKSKIPGINQ